MQRGGIPLPHLGRRGAEDHRRALKVDPGWREWRVAETRRRPHERRAPHPERGRAERHLVHGVDRPC